jgi:hypothetical protein
MPTLVEVIRSFPLLAILLIAVPLVGGVASGFVGAYLGYDNLTARLARERQQQRIESKAEEISQALKNISIPVETLRRYEQQAQANDQNLDVLKRILSQYDQLKNAVAINEKFIGREDAQDRIAAADHILTELHALLNVARTQPGPGGQILIIKTAPNTFRVTFAVPMRIAPALTFSGLPEGVEAHVIEKSNVGFTVVFTPTTIPVDKFGMQASAEL